MAGTIFINGRDLSDVGLELTAIRGWFDLPSLSRSAEQLTNTTGHALGTGVRVNSRTVELGFYLKPQLLADRATAMDAVADTFTGLCELRFVDKPGRVIRAYAEAVTTVAENETVGMIEPALSLRVTMVAYDALVYDIEPTVAALTTANTEIPLGSAPSGGILTLMGSFSSVVITYKNHAREVVGTLTLTGTVNSDEYVEVDLNNRTITKISNTGVRDETAYSMKSSGSWFQLDPGHGNRTVGAWPTLSLSAGTGVLIYRKAWQS